MVWAITRLFPRNGPGKGSGESAASVLDRRLDADTYRQPRGQLTSTR